MYLKDFLEMIYQRALKKEMELNRLAFSREHEMPIYYKKDKIDTRRVDFLVEGAVSVELKALTMLEEVHLAQAINYLKAYNLEIGLLVNFGAKSLDYRRVIKNKYQNRRLK
jgi:GxxExxY protein